MSNIDKMLIKGIRSFSPNNTVAIAFYKPLTLIVGHNGAGKTTVIECLKMVCTGELPPNTRSGQNFIHDPKVAGETEVKAQIKLRFYNAQGQPFIVIRSFQLTQKKTALQFKNLDNTLQTLDPETGQMAALPHRCASINTAVPMVMGVSKAILENVIFVHQEESNWPLAEGKVLKSKFDDIFASTKYTKALEELRRIRLKKMQEVKEMRLKLETLKTHKDHAARLRTTAVDGSRRADVLRAEIEQLGKDLKRVTDERKAIEAKLNSMASVGDEVMQLRTRHEFLCVKNAETHARLVATYPAEDLNMNEDEIEASKECMGASLTDLQGAIQQLDREHRSAEMSATALRDQRDRDVASHGRLVAESEAHKRNIVDRDNFLRRIATEAGIPNASGEGPLSAEAAAELRAAFVERVRAAGAEVDAAREQQHREDAEFARQIDSVMGEIRNATEGVRMKEEAVQANTKRVRELQMQIDADSGADNEALEAAMSRQGVAEERLQEKETELNQSNLEEQSREAATELAALSRRAEELRAERAQLAGAAEEATRMNMKAQDLATAEKKAAGQLNQWKPQLAMLLGKTSAEVPAPGAALTSAVQALLDVRRSKVESAAAAVREAQSKATSAEANVSAVTQQLGKAVKELEQLAQRLSSQVSGVQNVPQELVSLEKQRSEKSKKVYHADSYDLILSGQINYAKENASCSTCLRSFDNPAQCNEMIARLEEERNYFPTMLQQVKQELAAAEARIKALREVEPLAVRHDTLRDTEIPSLQSQIATLKTSAVGLRSSAESATKSHEDAVAALTEVQTIMQDVVSPLQRASQEIAQRRQEVESLRSSMRLLNAARSVADVDNDLASLESQRSQLEQTKDAAVSGLSKLRDNIAALRTEVHRAREEVLRLRSAVEKRVAAEAQLAELTSQSEALVAEVMASKNMAAPLQERKRAFETARESSRSAAVTSNKKLEQALRELQTKETQLEARERALADYNERGGPAALAAAESRLNSLKQRQAEAEEKAREMAIDLVDKRQQLAGAETLARQIEETLAYKRSVAEEKEVAAQIDARASSIAQVGDKHTLEARYKELGNEGRRLQSEADKKAGALGTVRQMAGDAAKELSDPLYDGIDAKYSMKTIEVKTTELATADLDKFHKALERALLAYHTTKMADINKIVKELWQKTYRGTDIDYIQIRADTESGTAARSYNYRVIMMCGGAELDMRGRCSAGQRVLACLVIRLALAETFCLNCGILALDEPTTNLDADNAASLAESLKAIMLARREQENFQLIVITHDEAFAHAIGTREHAEHMWRITKDDDQHSTLHQEDILE